MAYCAECGTEVKDGYIFCPECGTNLSTTSDVQSFNSYFGTYKTCKYCREKMPEDAFYCLNCGMAFDEPELDFNNLKNRVVNISKPQKRVVDTSVGTWKNKWVALILCLFLGVFGIHRFYEEKRVTGFLYLFTFGLFGYGVIINFILLLTKTNPYRVK